MGSTYAFNRYAEEYDEWYRDKRNSLILESEVKAIESLKPKGVGVEVGVGTGVFAVKFDVYIGLDPAKEMLKIAKKRGINVIQAVGESIPLRDNCFDYVLLVSTFCFLNDPQSFLKEAERILKDEGNLFIGFIPRDSKWGELYSKKKAEGHRFYRYATFYTLREIEDMLGKNFRIVDYCATLFQDPSNVEKVEEPSKRLSGGGFVCLRAVKRSS